MADNRQDDQAEQANGRTRTGQFAEGHTGNRAGRPRKVHQDAAAGAPIARADALDQASFHAQPAARFDGWYSLLTGLGTLARDKRESTQFVPDVIDWFTAEQVWRGDDLAARIIETLPNEMMREGYDLCITDDEADDGVGPDNDAEYEVDSLGKKTPIKKPGAPSPAEKAIAEHRNTFSAGMDPDIKKEVEHQWEELGLMDAIHDALYYERAYGGAAILIGANDGSADLENALVPGNVTGVEFLTTLEPREIQPIAWYGDPRAKKFGKPALYQLTPSMPGRTADNKSYATTNVKIHESRLIVFGGIRVTRRIQALNGGWGDSILTRVYRVLRDYNLSWGAAGTLVTDFAQAVYKMKGLNDLLRDDAKDLFKNRMIGMEMARSVARATMIDAEDDFTRIVTPISGLPDMLDRFTQRLCMAARLPLPLLAGESPSGLNASGASGDQLRMFYDSAKSEQKRKVVPVIRRVTQLIMIALGGEPAQWTIEPRALWQPTQKEQIETRAVQCKIDCDYMDRGVNSQEEIRESRFGSKAYSYDTKLIDNDDAIVQPSQTDIDAYAAEQSNAVGKPGTVAPGAKPGQLIAAGAPTRGAPIPNAGGPVAGPIGAPGADIQKQAMNGAQTQAMLEVITAVANKEIPLETAQIVLEVCFQLDPKDAQRMLAPMKNFEAAKPEPPPAFGGGAPFGGSKPPAAKPFGGPPAKTPPDDKAAE